ncbi:formate dehydrogenase accessory protein FdhE [Thermodesulfobacterium hydrogeniphilum]|uniref:formate dehydrogenase accessory protein FdhE domain-containing protein n=1 Tax=Thermodesulfobacterium hydrogeniphilum TaxID=161156 RepID=UPI00057050EF|nr:formate dehydrogenase accessory protein FdhE [Thermodesulfobacterium hydrogeniphilum]
MNKCVLISNLKKERPHLEEVLNLYEKLLQFKEKVKGASKVEEVLTPFAEIFDVPYEFVDFLKESIKKLNEDPFNNPLCLKDLPLEKEQGEEVERSLFILMKGFYLASERKGEYSFEEGKCPVCGSSPSLALIDEDNRRYIVCTLCETRGKIFRIGCANCLVRDPTQIDLLVDEDEIRIDLCKNCKSYIKSFKADVFDRFRDLFLIDLISLPLDVVAQERGYERKSPNVLGIRKV